MDTTRAIQAGAHVGRDQAGRDIRYDTTNVLPRPASQITRLLRKLADQIDNNETTQQFIDALQFYVDNRGDEDVVGLAEKLAKVGRSAEYSAALRKKEAFAKLLLRFENFSSAQELFAYILAIIHDVFDEKIIPNCDTLDQAGIEAIVDEHIVSKIFEEYAEGSDAFTLTQLHVRGMIYWLADKCFVRWHK